MSRSAVAFSRRFWPSYADVWRWHFYAGLVSIPFVVILSITGTIYLFRPQIEAWIDRPMDNLTFDGPRASAASQVVAALASTPGASLIAYELPATDRSAARVLVSSGGRTLRVYVHPQTLAILRISDENNRPMRWVFRIHGELLMGNYGSYLVEIAASWTIVMILSGLWLWWPRNARRWAGIAYPRLRSGSRIFWRDLHAVTGAWISGLVLLLLLSGLPWAKFWGDYFRKVRQLTHTAAAKQDWVNGAAKSSLSHSALDEHAGHGRSRGSRLLLTDFSPIDRILKTLAPMDLPPPVLILPPATAASPWSAKSDTANRPQRVELTMEPRSGKVIQRAGFSDKLLLDRVVGVGVAWHEGQLFGWINQLLGLVSALGLLLLCVSSAIMWWRRRSTGELGAPRPGDNPRRPAGLVLVLLLLAIYLPLFAASLITVSLLENLVLRQIRPVQKWLGLSPLRTT